MKRIAFQLFLFFSLTFLFLFICPKCCYCNIPNYFDCFDWSHAFFVEIFFPLLVVLEGFLLWLFVRYMKFWKHLLLSLALNFASFVLGILIVPVIDYYLPDEVYLVYIALILFAEYFLIAFLYRKFISWLHAIWITLVINTISISTFILFLVGLLFAPIFLVPEIKIKIREIRWRNQEILRNEYGRIYTKTLNTENGYKSWYECYDIASKKWHKVPFESVLDVSDRFIAVFDNSDSQMVTIQDSASSFCIYDRIDYVRLDKIGQLIGTLRYDDEITLQEDSITFLELGRKSILKIYDSENGEEVLEYSEFVLNNGLDWSPDSKKIAFVSFEDKNLYNERVEKIGYGVYRIKLNYISKYPKYIFVYDIEKDSLFEIGAGIEPRWSSDGESIAYLREGELYIYSLDKEISTKIEGVDRILDYELSPTGENIVVQTGFGIFFDGWYALVIMNIDNPSLRYLINQSNCPFEYLRWISPK
jgi:hypothetical protein